ncbi:acetyl-CoA carboxylase biotin carboxyl carrier protein subunit [Echinicola sediminis]
MFSVTINEENFSVEQNGDDFLVNGKSIHWDIQAIDKRHFHILYHHKSYRAELVNIDHAQKRLSLKINGKSAEVQVKDKFDLLLEKLGMNGQVNQQFESLAAPMPGLILEIKVQPGDTVSQGQPVLILEAMKMENVLKSPGDGTVRKIMVTKGDSVEKNQVLIQF